MGLNASGVAGRQIIGAYAPTAFLEELRGSFRYVPPQREGQALDDYDIDALRTVLTTAKTPQHLARILRVFDGLLATSINHRYLHANASDHLFNNGSRVCLRACGALSSREKGEGGDEAISSIGSHASDVIAVNNEVDEADLSPHGRRMTSDATNSTGNRTSDGIAVNREIDQAMTGEKQTEASNAVPMQAAADRALSTEMCETSGDVLLSQKISNYDGGLPFDLDAEDKWGIAMSSIGDLNQDGVIDLAVGALHDDDGANGAGAVYVLFMNASGVVQSAQKISNSHGNLPITLEAGDGFGVSVALLGNLSGDSSTAIAVGAYADDDGNTDAGAVYILFVNSVGVVSSRRKISNNAGNFPFTIGQSDYFGRSVVSLGDLNGDGVPDLAVGAHCDDDGNTQAGAVYVLLLTASGAVSAAQKLSNSAGDLPFVLSTWHLFGCALTMIEAFTEDQATALVVGAPSTGAGTGAGAVYVLTLGASGLVASGQEISNSVGGLPFALVDGDSFGNSLAPVGDLNLDGIQDLAVGAYDDDDGATNAGAIYLLMLDGDGAVVKGHKLSNSFGNLPFTLTSDDRFGYAVASIGDLNGDGTIDLAVSADQDDDGGFNAGAVYVLFFHEMCPSPSPTPIPTPEPTVSPTPNTEFTMAPESLLLSTTKPGNATGKMYIVNLNDAAMSGSVQLHSRSLMVDGASSIDPETFTVGPGQLATIGVRIASSGLEPDIYDLRFDVAAQTENSLPINQTYTAELSIFAKAIASMTHVHISGSPTLGKDWDGISIYPRDSDGFKIVTDSGEDFSTSLTSPTGVASSCQVNWIDFHYQGRCSVPAVLEAGDWSLTIALDGGAFTSSVVQMNCKRGDFEDPQTRTCKVCPMGTTCPTDGTTLESLHIDPGYWRSGENRFVPSRP